MMFHVPPCNGGRIVEVSYAAACDGMVIRRTYDRSDGTVCYHIAAMLLDDEGDYWQREPRNRRWRKMTKRDFLRYDLLLGPVS